jgi:hypothetical protein
MEFDDIKKIWDSQNNEYMYAINEQALHNRILAKKNKAVRITDISELLLLVTNLGAGFTVLLLNMTDKTPSISLFIMAGWMLLSGLYTLANRLKRLAGSRQFNRSVLGDLGYAVSVAVYQVRLSQINRWNVLPIAIFSVLAMWENAKPIWISALLIVFFLLTYFASRWEHGLYVARKNELESLQKKFVRPE